MVHSQPNQPRHASQPSLRALVVAGLAVIAGLAGLAVVAGLVLSLTWSTPVVATATAADPAPTPTQADGHSRPRKTGAAQGLVMPSTAAPGEEVIVTARGWPAHTQVQAVVCGDLGIGGSAACHRAGAVLGSSDADGTIRLALTVAAPPRPCPCVVRVTSFSSAAPRLDLGLVVAGHRVGTPPVEAAPRATLSLQTVRVENPTSGVLWGLGGEADLVVTVANKGSVAARVPALRHRLGSASTPSAVSEPQVRIPPGQQREVRIRVAVPAGAGGTFAPEVRWADGTGQAVRGTWHTRPWLGWAGLAWPWWWWADWWCGDWWSEGWPAGSAAQPPSQGVAGEHPAPARHGSTHCRTWWSSTASRGCW